MSVGPCSTTPAPAHGVVIFDLAAFRVLYPEFTTVPDAAIAFNFTLATFMVDNSCYSVVSDGTKREVLLNVLTAHLTALANGVNGQPAAGIVGRIDSATEGTVSVSAGYATQISGSMAYFIQTKYGALFWQLTASFRSFRYIPKPVPYCGPGGGQNGFGYNNGPGY